jgi:sulfur carrier protein ThiS
MFFVKERRERIMILNVNGDSYRVISQSKKYMLLERLTGKGKKYVVCYKNGQIYKNKHNQEYFDVLEEALEYYYAKTYEN